MTKGQRPVCPDDWRIVQHCRQPPSCWSVQTIGPSAASANLQRQVRSEV
jgi:hypothetical protein